jgi:predicted  nucleic acid-binding Zn-ribbon protein
MHQDLEHLIRLQQADDELRRLRAELAELPRQQAELEAALGQDRSRLAGARDELDGCGKNRKRLEGELQDLEAKRSKYKGQLMEVKTNKEYTAMLHEIEAVEREIRSREDQILEEMERAETLQATVKREEGVFREAEQRHQAERGRLAGRQVELERRAATREGEREAVAAELPEDVLHIYQRVVKLRGSGVAEARDEMCQACRVKLQPQVYVDVKRNDGLQRCPSCNRILYYEPPPPVVEPPSA